MASRSAIVRNLFFPGLWMLVLVAGCSTREHRAIELTTAGSHLDLPALDCELSFDGIIDRRPGERLVDPSLHTCEVGDLLGYLEDHIEAMLCCGESGSEMKIELRHAYARGMAMRGFYTVVLTLELDDRQPTLVRGRHNVTNWVGSSHEFRRGLTAAAHQALRELNAVLAESSYCEVPRQENREVAGYPENPG